MLVCTAYRRRSLASVSILFKHNTLDFFFIALNLKSHYFLFNPEETPNEIKRHERTKVHKTTYTLERNETQFSESHTESKNKGGKKHKQEL